MNPQIAESPNLVAVGGNLQPTVHIIKYVVQSRYCWDQKTCPLYRIAKCPHSGSLLVHKLMEFYLGPLIMSALQ